MTELWPKQWTDVGKHSALVFSSFKLQFFVNPYSRRFDEYKRVFYNEVENLSNEYTLRIGKKGYEEEELWRSGDEKIDYEPPFVDVKAFEVKKYSFKRGQSFICITKQDDDALPLGRVNGARFKAMIRKELKETTCSSS
ncbi:hypothetical protein Tco_1091026 [Tanacetum coccineum]|uniref:Uncharacterized protein n=1 Tax=Tanacetum coccineum TaxID=301880 RepID=A0ABQ5I5V9_9ASTR